MVFFYSYVYESCYENNVDRYFTYLSGYTDDGTARPSLLSFQPGGEFTPLSDTTLFGCRGVDHEDIGKR